ncbi:hypothetical protein CBS101457_005033 [Exobasidium rhododendri]|nr:hypothetical protein CBS101457_005033 [Exobasidium rhododendri]
MQRSRGLQVDETLYKLFTMFFSSFEEILFLEASNLVLNNPINLFKEEPFLTNGLVMWPDFMAASPSRTLSLVQKKTNTSAKTEKVNTIADPPHRGRNIKLSQLVISKRKHARSLLLAIYYSFYGPHMYNALIQQGSGVVGGDLSLLAAAEYFGIKAYTVKRSAEATGYPDIDRPGSPFVTTGMVFYSPSDDFHKRRPDWHLPYFVTSISHRNDASDLQESGKMWFTKTVQRSHRIWEWFSARNLPTAWNVKDPEQALWQEVTSIACQQSYLFNAAVTAAQDEICRKSQLHYDDMWPTL